MPDEAARPTPPVMRTRTASCIRTDRGGSSPGIAPSPLAVWVQNGLAVVLGFIAGVWNFCRGLSGMSLVGKVESLWRYPVKSMRGEELQEAFVGFSGVYGDRLFAFKSSAAPKGFPYLTGREQEEMLLFALAFAIRKEPQNL